MVEYIDHDDLGTDYFRGTLDYAAKYYSFAVSHSVLSRFPKLNEIKSCERRDMLKIYRLISELKEFALEHNIVLS